MWSREVFIVLCFAVLQFECKTYYFTLNRTSNEYTIRSRLNANYSAPTSYNSGVYLSELRNNVGRKKNSSVVQTHPLLDPEWDYNWKNLTRPKLPTYITKYYDMFSGNMTGSVRFLFNAKPQNSTIIHYNISDVDVNDDITEAELHFYHKVDKNNFQKSLILRLYQKDNNYINESSLINPDAHKLLNVIYIYQAESGWQVFKVTNALLPLLKNRTDLSLFITISKPNEEQFSMFKDIHKDVLRTFIVLKSDSSDNNGLSKTNETIHNYNACRKYNLHVDFERFNWMKFIISPSGYDAFNCYGACYKNDEKLPNHLKITNFAPEINRKAMCCAPTSYNSLPIMFYDKYGNVVIKIYKEMIIAACGCR